MKPCASTAARGSPRIPSFSNRWQLTARPHAAGFSSRPRRSISTAARSCSAPICGTQTSTSGARTSPLSAASSPTRSVASALKNPNGTPRKAIGPAFIEGDTCRFTLGGARRDYLCRLRYQLGVEIPEQRLGLQEASAGGGAGGGRQRDGLVPLDCLFGEEGPSDQVFHPLLDREVPKAEGVPHPAVDLVDDQRGRTGPIAAERARPPQQHDDRPILVGDEMIHCVIDMRRVESLLSDDEFGRFPPFLIVGAQKIEDRGDRLPIVSQDWRVKAIETAECSAKLCDRAAAVTIEGLI